MHVLRLVLVCALGALLCDAAGYGGYTVQCPGNVAPLNGADSQPLACQNDNACGSSNYYCQANPLANRPGVCCPKCPGGMEPLTSKPDNTTVSCDANQACSSANYFCSTVPQKGGFCCPLCPSGGYAKHNDNGETMTCTTDNECCEAGSHFCSPNPVKGKPNVCCPKCPAGGIPLVNQGTTSDLTPCETDQCCNSPGYFCAKNPQPPAEPPKPNLCCPQCPCGSNPLMDANNALLPCETDQCCQDPTYYCFVSNVTGKANVCCPRSPADMGTAMVGDTTTMIVPDMTPPAPTLPAPSGDVTTQQAPTIAPTPAASQHSSNTWESMFATYRQKNASFVVPTAQAFWTKQDGRLVMTTGQFTPCTKNADCYNSREPSEWCRSMPKYSWVGSGCTCVTSNISSPSCIIVREEVSTKNREWTFCQLMSQFRCV